MKRHDDDSVYSIARVVITPALHFWTRYEVSGVQWRDVPSGPLIIVANHVSWLDPVLIAYSCPHQMTLLAKEELFQQRFLGSLFRRWHMIPVRRGEFDRTLLRRALEVLSQGGILGLFPEGSRSREGAMREGLTGAAFFALHSGAPILPIGISGTRGAKVFPMPGQRAKAVLNIGHAFHLPAACFCFRRSHL